VLALGPVILNSAPDHYVGTEVVFKTRATLLQTCLLYYADVLDIMFV